jgi:hypothetical protein
MPTLIARGCAALAIVLLAPLAASAAGSPLKIESVSPSDRSALPADTEVIVAGRTVTLGALRDQHAALLHSFSAAATLGRQAASSHPVTLGVQMKVVPLNDPFYARYSADYRAFCGAAQLTICAYLPAATTVTYLAHNGEIIDDFFNIIDPLITDATLCQSQGGTPNGNSGCRFMYPAKFHEQFNPGAPGAMAQNTSCTADRRSARRGRIHDGIDGDTGQRIFRDARIARHVRHRRHRSERYARALNRHAKNSRETLFLREYVAQFLERLLLQARYVHLRDVEALGDLGL